MSNLRWVASGIDSLGTLTETLRELRLYWTLPSNYPETDALRANWSIEVARYNTADETWPVVVADTADPPSQWQSATGAVDELLTARQQYRVRYINNGGTSEASETADDAPGVERRFNPPQLTAAVFASGVLPKITEANNDLTMGLRFAYNEIHPDVWLDLIWAEEPNDDGNPPTGFEIDVTEATTINEHTVWTPVRNQPIDLGATRQYTHKGVIPGKQYTYRVFPEFGGYLGIPAVEDASSRAARVPDPVRGLRVDPDPDNPQTSLVLDWPRVTNDGGHDIMGYLVEVASDEDNNKTLADNATWESLNIKDNTDVTPNIEAKPWSVDKDTLMYTYDGSTAAVLDALSGGYVRWFRVFAITVENDGKVSTGGTARMVSNGEPMNPPSDDSSTPTPADIAGADPKPGMTDDPQCGRRPDANHVAPGSGGPDRRAGQRQQPDPAHRAGRSAAVERA